MKIIKFTTFLFLLSCSINLFGQVENVPLDHPVYNFLKELKVKQIIPSIHEGVPNMSRREIRSYLEIISEKTGLLSRVERENYEKYKLEFYDELQSQENTTELFNFENNIDRNVAGIFSQKLKYLYVYKKKDLNLFVEMNGQLRHGQSFKPEIANSEIYDIGVNFRGTFLKNFGYNFFALKGQTKGSRDLAQTVFPELRHNFKFVLNQEETSNHDISKGYIKYETEPGQNLMVMAQLGREKLRVGFGYSESLALSGYGADMDFLKLQFRWKSLTYTSIHGMTVGRYKSGIADRYSKYLAINRLGFSFPDLFDIGFGESIVYADRGLELGYINPFIFYKFAEHSMQDRDNGVIFADIQTSFLPGIEFQASVFLDETLDIFSIDRFINKTAYQAGFFVYAPFGLDDLSIVFEYTKIRPYVYTHTFEYNTYSSWEESFGNQIGPNADQIFANAAYNISSRVRAEFTYKFIRRGENIYDPSGALIRNVGGDIFTPHDQYRDADLAYFLDGDRFNDQILTAFLRIEPVREIYFDFVYNYKFERNFKVKCSNEMSYGYIRMLVEY